MGNAPASEAKKQLFILYIDDQEADAVFLETAMKSVGISCEYRHIDSAEAAENFLFSGNEKRPDIVFLDVSLPRKDGHEVLKNIRTNPQTRHIPVIMLSGSTLQKDIHESYANLANAHVKKPQTFDAMIDFLKAFEQFWIKCALLPDGNTHAT